ncbi:uncharacterized protein V1510DRAFT_402440 [Dipodascopsis tothii]|uniref:uncharacterized protein n=1 Tax=Dipodascopsis tothii TaxID=44089 RepID=UPI0034CF823E
MPETKPKKPAAAKGSLKAEERTAKPVLRSVLDNPHVRVAWPSLDGQDTENALNLLCSFLTPIGNYRRTQARDRALAGKRKRDDGDIEAAVPEVHPYVLAGINAVTGALEAQSPRMVATEVTAALVRPPTPWQRAHPVRVVFVCRSDVTPALLTAHLPLLCHSAATAEAPVALVSLPAGSLSRLSSALGLRHVGVVAVRAGAPSAAAVYAAVAAVPPVRVPWDDGAYAGLRVKHLATTAPGPRRPKPVQEAKK